MSPKPAISLEKNSLMPIRYQTLKNVISSRARNLYGMDLDSSLTLGTTRYDAIWYELLAVVLFNSAVQTRIISSLFPYEELS